MLWNEFLTFTLIPTLINMENGTTLNTTMESFDDLFPTTENTGKGDIIPISRVANRDPLLAQVLEEEQQLNLAFPDDYFDHLEDKSEEVRELIRTRKEAIESQAHFSSPSKYDDVGIRSRSDLDETSTQFPILIPETGPEDNSASTTLPPPQSTSSNKPTPSKGAMASIFDKIHQDAHVAIDTVSRPFINARSLFGRKQTTTTTSSPQNSVPERIMVEPTPLAPTGPLNCKPVQTEYNGQCYNVLQQTPCNNGSWLIEDPATNKGRCVENKCATATTTGQRQQGLAFYGGECIFVSTDKPCHPGMRTVIYKSGVVACECKDGYLFRETDGNCHPAYRQGPCPSGQYFIIPIKTGESTSKPTCMPNPCLTDGYFCNAARCPRQRNCAQLGTTCGANGRLGINPPTNTPMCLETHQLTIEDIIGNVPTLSCAPGTRRDILGNCRTPADITFS